MENIMAENQEKKNEEIREFGQIQMKNKISLLTIIGEIEGHEMGVKALTGGLTSEDLVVKKVEDTGKVDKDGKPVKVTKYEPKAGVVVFNEEANVYEIHVEEPAIDNVAPETVDDAEKAPEVEVKAEGDSPFPNNLPY